MPGERWTSTSPKTTESRAFGLQGLKEQGFGNIGPHLASTLRVEGKLVKASTKDGPGDQFLNMAVLEDRGGAAKYRWNG